MHISKNNNNNFAQAVKNSLICYAGQSGQLTLSQPGRGRLFQPQSSAPPPHFQTYLRHWYVKIKDHCM